MKFQRIALLALLVLLLTWCGAKGNGLLLHLSFDEGTDLMMAPIDALHNLEADPIVNLTGLSMEEANAALADMDEDLLYLRLTADLADAQKFSIHVKSGGEKDDSVFTWSASDGTISASTRNRGKAAKTGFVSGPLTIEDGILNAEIYIDRSLVEAYFNNTKSISLRSFADFDSRSIYLDADGDVTVVSVYAAPMKSIYS